MKYEKENWNGNCCVDIGNSLTRNSNKKAYQLIKDLTTENIGHATIGLDKPGKFLSEEKDILNRLTKYFRSIHPYI